MSAYRTEHVTSVIEEMAEALDERLWDRVESYFASRVVLDYGVPELLTPADIVGRWRPLLSAFDRTHHVIEDLTVRFEPVDRARLDARFRADHELAGVRWRLRGRYEYELVLVESEWKITRMRMIPEDSAGDASLVDQARAKAGVGAPEPLPYRTERITFDVAGERVVGLVYLPATPTTEQLPAVGIFGPITSVKEQVVALYAQRLAAAGFVALTIDFRHHGESDGTPRHLESPARKIIDIRAAIDQLERHPNVDSARLSLLGVCAGAGYVAATAAIDARVKRVALVAPWLQDARLVESVYGQREAFGGLGEGIAALVEAGNQARVRFESDGTTDYVPTASAVDRRAVVHHDAGFLDYYLNEQRGGIPQWANRFAVMSWPEWLEFDAIGSAPLLRQPTLIIDTRCGLLPEGTQRFAAAMQQAPNVVLTEDAPFDFYDAIATIDRASVEVIAHLR